MKIIKKKFDIDFRRDSYIINSFNLSPVMDYLRAEEIILFSNKLLENNNFNLSIEVNNLKTDTLKFYLECLINDSDILKDL